MDPSVALSIGTGSEPSLGHNVLGRGGQPASGFLDQRGRAKDPGFEFVVADDLPVGWEHKAPFGGGKHPDRERLERRVELERRNVLGNFAKTRGVIAACALVAALRLAVGVGFAGGIQVLTNRRGNGRTAVLGAQAFSLETAMARTVIVPGDVARASPGQFRVLVVRWNDFSLVGFDSEANRSRRTRVGVAAKARTVAQFAGNSARGSDGCTGIALVAVGVGRARSVGTAAKRGAPARQSARRARGADGRRKSVDIQSECDGGEGNEGSQRRAQECGELAPSAEDAG